MDPEWSDGCCEGCSAIDSDGWIDADRWDAESDGRREDVLVKDDGVIDSPTSLGARAKLAVTMLDGLDSHWIDSVTLPELSLRGDSGRSTRITAGGGGACITTSSVGSGRSAATQCIG